VNRIHLVGFGSQGSAWSLNLRDAGWEVCLYGSGRSDSPSTRRALEAGFEVRPFAALRTALEPGAQVALLIPDRAIPGFYAEWLSQVPHALELVLAHGYAAAFGGLTPRAGHRLALLAPKAIGPELRRAFVEGGGAHGLKAAVSGNVGRLAEGLGISPAHQIPADFRSECVGDLISEQLLLCGGVFPWLGATMERMRAHGVPEALIREECLTELELVARVLRAEGPSGAFRKISEAAQFGTARMFERLERMGFMEAAAAQAEESASGEFAKLYAREDSTRAIARFATWLKEKEGSA
jgi:ketol-acid reductoisomerase